MKKVIGILFLCIVMCMTDSFAAYPEELENAELEQLQNDQVELISETQEVTPIEPRTSETEIVVIEDDVYKFEESPVITGIIDGNVYVMGETVTVKDAVIHGSLYALAGKIEVTNSDIGGSVYVIADDIIFSGTTNDIYALGGDIECDLDSYVWRTARIACESLNINGEIARDLYASVDGLQVGDRAVIGGKMEYSSDEAGDISEAAQIGELKFNQTEQEPVEESVPNMAEYVLDVVSVILRTLIISAIIVLCGDKFKKISRTENVATDLLKSMCKGAGVLVFVPVIGFILIITIIGIALGFSVFAIYAVLLYIAIPVIATDIAYRILTRKKDEEIKNGKIIGVSILVAIVIWAIDLIPVVGGSIKFILMLMGLGVLFDIMFQKAKKEEISGVINES